jgi:hypothetical protein
MHSHLKSRGELPSPLERIGVVAVLARYPVHRLSRQGAMPIAIQEASADGQAIVSWNVGWHSEYGQGGLLAYKLDTLVVNRKLDEAGRPIPHVLRLGGLYEIARDLGLATHDTRIIRDALYQNASAFITAKVRYKARDGSERWIEIGSTRYAVVFTGERLPDGRTADAVHLVLNDVYREIVDHAQTRPLDYDYLRGLPPAAQRLYELLSYPIFGALAHGRPEARMPYSEFCTYAPQTRYAEFWRMRRQMEKLHRPHRTSGYLAGIEYEPTTDRDGRPDWTLVYEPGTKARAEHRAFTSKGSLVATRAELPLGAPEPPLAASAKAATSPEPEPTGLERELVERGVTRSVAADLVRNFPAERLRRQIEVVDWLRETKPKRIKDVGAYLADAIRKDFAPPAGFRSRAERAEAEATARARQEQQELARQATARARAVEAQVQAYWAEQPPDEQKRLEAAALAGADPADRAAYEAAAAPPVRRMLQAGLRDAHLRRLLGLPAAD